MEIIKNILVANYFDLYMEGWVIISVTIQKFRGHFYKRVNLRDTTYPVDPALAQKHLS